VEKAVVASLKEGIVRAKAHAQKFAFSPNGEHPILIVRAPAERAVTLANFKVEAEKDAGASFQGGSVFIGELTVANGALRFKVDPERSSGTIDAAKMQRGLIKIGKAAKLPKLAAADVVIGEEEVNDGRPQAKTESGAAARRRIERRLQDLGGLFGQAAFHDGDPVGGKIVLANMAAFRDELKLFLETKAAKTPVLPGKKKRDVKDLVERVQEALAEVGRVARVLRDSFHNAPKSPPDSQRNVVEPLALDLNALGGVSKTLKAAAKAYAEHAGNDPDAHRKALHELRTAALAWQVRHPNPSQADGAMVRRLIANTDDRLVELDIQSGVDKGYISTTGADDRPGGQSGSYFVGDPTRARKFVVKPVLQEAPVGGNAVQGDGARNEVTATRAAKWLQQLGLDPGMPDAHLITIKSDKVAQVGRAIATGGSSAVTLEGAQQHDHPAVAVKTVDGAQGSVLDLVWRQHPQYPNIRMKAVAVADFSQWTQVNIVAARPLFEAGFPNWDQLDDEAQVREIEAFLAKDGFHPVYEFPVEFTENQLKRDVAVGLMMCVVTGQIDHSNPDNALISRKDGVGRVVPIDFGASVPGLKDAALSLTPSRINPKDPWGLWMTLPHTDQPMPTDVLDQMAGLDVDGLTGALAEEEDRVADASGGAIRSTDEVQRRVRKFMMDAMSYAVRHGRQLNPVVQLSPQQLHDVFVNTGGRTGPVAKALTRMQALTAPNRTENAWNDAWQQFTQDVNDLLVNGP
jgi:hypothetical protein